MQSEVRLVCLHGFLGTPDSFQDVAEWLGRDVELYAPALFGHSGYREAALSCDFEGEIARLISQIERRAAGVPIHLAGYSLGARLALGLLVRAPRLFHSATLISARRGLDTTAEREQRWVSDQGWAQRLRDTPLSSFLDAWESQPIFASMLRLAPHRLHRLREQRLRHDPEALARALLGLTLAKMPSFCDELTQIAAPVTLVAGALDPKFVELGEDLRSRLPNGNLVVVDGAGHQLLIERPDAVAAAIVEGMKHDPRSMGKSPSI